MPVADDLTLRLSRILDAPRADVFAACTRPQELQRWWGPKGFSTPHLELDVRVGGSYRIAMQPPGGEVFFLTGEYREVTAPSRLAYTFLWDPPDADDVETLAVLDLEDLGERTRLDLTHGRFATPARFELHEAGWGETLDRLQELLSAKNSAAKGRA